MAPFLRAVKKHRGYLILADNKVHHANKKEKGRRILYNKSHAFES